ncbi:hypothetical protein BDZ91DRAFT_35431 [Kalaharituber pfeilii]|nr:hypothetical protein BDZ91DRAFT_35431 [Kalaharituber pfeilii]
MRLLKEERGTMTAWMRLPEREGGPEGLRSGDYHKGERGPEGDGYIRRERRRPSIIIIVVEGDHSITGLLFCQSCSVL